ncbi:MAG TPA: PQQ-binding-like beta-propeller repeat protein [Bryobacteraceae bacterium]|nr:PQQ-binding-like beta-propeller repeat protein [Bryobacteraceae bacterium]
MAPYHKVKRAATLAAGTVLLLTFLFTRVATQTITPNRVDWPSYGNDLGAMRFVNIDQINRSNVAQLQPVWILHTQVMGPDTSFESQPIIIDGVMYATSPHGHVFALDATTGAIKWTFNPDFLAPLSELAICCGQDNRGVAVGNGKVFVGQLDATLVALDAATGNVVWKVVVDRWQDRWTETMAPLFINGLVIIGASGGEYQRRGHVRAYNANTGARVWEFNTVPGPGEFGNDTWAGDSWRTGGANVWTTPAADPQLGLIYITTANAAPDLNGSQRAGTNLFTASVVALDVATGQRRWHFQEIHHEIWDYDCTQPAHLFTLERNGQQIPAIGHANKAGFYYILDRRDGRPLFDVTETPVPIEPAWQRPWPTQPIPAIDPVIPQTVASAPAGVRTGPIFTVPQEQPTLIQPGAESGPEWPPGAYSPRTRYSYLQAGGYSPWTYSAIPTVVNSLGSTVALNDIPGIETFGLFVAMNTTTGKIAWSKRLPQKFYSGVVVAGDLVFFGEGNGQFNAADAQTGNVLWTFKSNLPNVGGANGAPAVYVVNGREYVVMAFGGNADAGFTKGDALIAFALPQGGQTPQPMVVTANPRQVPTGDLPASAMQPPLAAAPPDARVVELVTHDFDFQPESFTALAGEKIAVHIVNTGNSSTGFNITLPTGRIGLSATIASNQSGYFVFTAPSQPGVFEFFGSGRFFGQTGLMRVGPACPTSVTPCLDVTGITGSATFDSTAVAPGQLVTLFGRGIGPDSGVLAPSFPAVASLPTSLGDTQVFFNGVAAPLLFAQANQVNAIVPFEVVGPGTADVEISHSGQMTQTVTVSVVEKQPGIFTIGGTGSGQAIVQNADGSLNSSSNLAAKGSTVSIFATGAGQTTPALPDGAFAPNDFSRPILRITVLIGGIGAEVIDARVPQGLFAGLIQVDVRIPAGAPSGPQVSLELGVGDVLSPPTTLAIQ